MGLFWEGQTLWCVGDGGLRCYRDAGGAGRLRAPELVFPLRTGGEHDAHAVRRGPDGWLYLLCGNNARINKSHASLPTSPIKDPVAGCVLRLPPDLKGCEVVADGFRNAYGMDWSADGELFTFDSDNERCVSLPWYEPTTSYPIYTNKGTPSTPAAARTWQNLPRPAGGQLGSAPVSSRARTASSQRACASLPSMPRTSRGSGGPSRRHREGRAAS
jgi:hypothetical protein